ncbi:lytic transglycosylase domain-containing protein [Streptomyces griseorubiginosus]|uniref:lytic transglycosylase domain-containing protein n=1 Tax=Streptomyces griseorubiginosus TaxID=67304 RepID=UPI001AD6AFD4|nr:lytic transglycosylase domain-containing protein [Streptomyces griseorubiginosus]MBO4258444.1 lytic transglycosylase domain-containing protein [Streptomyces griseorubiginosus]
MSDFRAVRYRRLALMVVFALAVYVLVRAANTPQGHAPPPAGKTVPVPTPTAGSPSASRSSAPSSYDPADYAPQVRTRAREAGVSARLVMAILYNEAYKPHDPALERAWQKIKPGAAFGIADMHRATFDEVKKGRDFADRDWTELPDDRDLAIEAEAWYLHDLAARLPAQWSAPYTKDELLALGYDAGPGNMLAFARGATPGTDAQAYLDRLHADWAEAGTAVGS